MSPAKRGHDRPAGRDGDDTATSDLERRYARWIALCYPADYRRERGSELVDTYLRLAVSDRRRPSAADVADLVAGGLRQHLRIAQGRGPGIRVAGLLALLTATALATGWTILELLAPWASPVRPFPALDVAPWAAWLLAAVVYGATPGRWFRPAAGLAIGVTIGVVPTAMLTGLSRPPLSVPALPAAVVMLLAGTTLLALGLAARRDSRGGWALLILLTPIGLLALNPLGAVLDDTGPGQYRTAHVSSLASWTSATGQPSTPSPPTSTESTSSSPTPPRG